MTDDDFPSRWLSIQGARERVEYELQKIADDDFLTRWPHIRDNKKEPRSGLLYERSRFPPKYPSRYAHMYAFEITDGNHFTPISLGMTEVESTSCRNPREYDCGKKVRYCFTKLSDPVYELRILLSNIYLRENLLEIIFAEYVLWIFNIIILHIRLFIIFWYLRSIFIKWTWYINNKNYNLREKIYQI